jgi:hypothetical protein
VVLVAGVVCRGGAEEFQINTYTTGTQSEARVAAAADGSFVAAWSSDGSYGTDTQGSSAQARRFDSNGQPLGPEFQVNTFTPDRQAPWAVAETPDGRFVVVWWTT